MCGQDVMEQVRRDSFYWGFCAGLFTTIVIFGIIIIH
jgi:hypothetical protein